MHAGVSLNRSFAGRYTLYWLKGAQTAGEAGGLPLKKLPLTQPINKGGYGWVQTSSVSHSETSQWNAVMREVPSRVGSPSVRGVKLLLSEIHCRLLSARPPHPLSSIGAVAEDSASQ